MGPVGLSSCPDQRLHAARSWAGTHDQVIVSVPDAHHGFIVSASEDSLVTLPRGRGGPDGPPWPIEFP